MSILAELDWRAVLTLYHERQGVHEQLLRLHERSDLVHFGNLLLGIGNPAGNYSAAEHTLGPRILTENANALHRIHQLTGDFLALKKARDVPNLIRSAGLRYLQIGVGSEASCMIRPAVCWVANTRTIWTHLVIKHADNVARANEELRLYREADVSSEMSYAMWSRIHGELETSMTRIAEAGEELARRADLQPGEVKFLWADAIANRLYEMYHGI